MTNPIGICNKCGSPTSQEQSFCVECQEREPRESNQIPAAIPNENQRQKSPTDALRVAQWIQEKADSEDSPGPGETDELPNPEEQEPPPQKSKSSVGAAARLSMLGFLFFLPTTAQGGNPVGALFDCLLAIITFRLWFRRRVYTRLEIISDISPFFGRVYVPAFLSYTWRSLLFVVILPFVVAFLIGDWEVGGRFLGVMLFMWLLATVLSLDVPLWANRTLPKQKLTFAVLGLYSLLLIGFIAIAVNLDSSPQGKSPSSLQQTSTNQKSGLIDASPNATTGNAETVNGVALNYSIQKPAHWTTIRNELDFDTLLTNQSLFFGVIAEEFSLGSPEKTVELARQNLIDAGSTEIQWTEPTTITIDGRHWMEFSAKCRVEDIPVSYFFNVYAGDEGTFQLVGWTSQNLFERNLTIFRGLCRTFRFPQPSPGADSAQPFTQDFTSEETSLLKGDQFDYTLRLPDPWKTVTNREDYDTLSHHKSLYLGVIAEEADLGSPENLLEIVQENHRQNVAGVSWTEPESIKIDGERWLQFETNAVVQNIPLTFLFYVYSGSFGSYQIIGWTVQDLFDRDRPLLEQIVKTFQFPGVR